MGNLEDIIEKFTYEDRISVIKTMTDEEKEFEGKRLEEEIKYYRYVQRFLLEYIEHENALSINSGIVSKM